MNSRWCLEMQKQIWKMWEDWKTDGFLYHDPSHSFEVSSGSAWSEVAVSDSTHTHQVIASVGSFRQPYDALIALEIFRDFPEECWHSTSSLTPVSRYSDDSDQGLAG
jgi:hypothetical protein